MKTNASLSERLKEILIYLFFISLFESYNIISRTIEDFYCCYVTPHGLAWNFPSKMKKRKINFASVLLFNIATKSRQ